MNPRDPNVALIEKVAGALGELNATMTYIGGCAVGLLLTDTGRPPVRATKDVDLVTKLSSKAEYYQLSKKMKDRGFTEDKETICRWNLEGLQVDIIPSDQHILGFSNRWYGEAIRNPSRERLPSGREIELIRAPVFIATKFEAFHDRGAGDYQASHDLEDIVNVVDGRSELFDEVVKESQELQDYLRDEFDGLLGEPAFLRAIPLLVSPDQGNSDRVGTVLQRMRRLAGL